jgi:hypothetical protein
MSYLQYVPDYDRFAVEQSVCQGMTLTTKTKFIPD